MVMNPVILRDSTDRDLIYAIVEVNCMTSEFQEKIDKVKAALQNDEWQLDDVLGKIPEVITCTGDYGEAYI